MRKGGAVRTKGFLTARFDLALVAMGLGPCMFPPSPGKGGERMEWRIRQWWAAFWWAVTLALKGHLAAALTLKCHPSAPTLNMLLLLLQLFQEMAAPSTFAWSHQPVIWDSKIHSGWTSHFRIRQELFSLSCTVTQHFPSSYLQHPSSRLLRISAVQGAPDCTSSSPCPDIY